jgi:D-3-phosphoglycerate dehydrogenase
VPVAITSGANAGPVAELAIALMLGVYRRIAFVDRKLRQGQWVRAEMRTVCYQIAGKTVGVYGFGNIGRTLAHRLRGFDAEVLYYDIRRAEAVVERALGARFVPFEELLSRSDILSVHVPLTDLTRASIGAKEIARMKSGAIIVNTARGGIVDETALYQALVAGRLCGAGLDVFDAEPADAAHPLLTLDQVVASPHIGGGVFDNVAHVARRAFGNIQQVLEGNPIPAADLIVPPRAAPAA